MADSLMTWNLADVLQSTLAMLILKSVASQDRHGYDIARWIADTSKGSLSIEEGSLYPALRRLEDRGFVKSSWKLSDTGRRVRMYALTRTGRAYLDRGTSDWTELSRAVMLVMRAEPARA